MNTLCFEFVLHLTKVHKSYMINSVLTGVLTIDSLFCSIFVFHNPNMQKKFLKIINIEMHDKILHQFEHQY